jgi:peptidoglycan/xylan/chitin deacetylase (PgdA/CDA1 family)
MQATIPISVLSGHYGRSGFGILMYHRIGEPVQGIEPPTWNVTPATLHRQLQYLQQRGFEAWPLAAIAAHCQAGIPIPRQVFAVTFDDGYRCVLQHALPVLEALQVPATLFLSTGFLGASGKMPMDDWSAAGSPAVPKALYEPLTLKECDALLASPLITLGSHTHSHGDFRGNLDAFHRDVATSKEFFQGHWGIKDPPFAYPYGCSLSGYCSPEMRDIIRRQGFSCAVTSDSRIVDPVHDDRFAWGRIAVSASDSGRSLAAKLDNWYGAMRRFSQRVIPFFA